MNLHWSTHQLTEYLAAVGAAADEAGAFTVGVERAAEAVDAEIGCVVIDGGVFGLLGVDDTEAPQLAGCQCGLGRVQLPGLPPCCTVRVPLGREVPGDLVIVREEVDFGPEEHQMLQGMARVLGLTVRSLRTLAVERRLREQNEQEAQHRLELLQVLRTRERLLQSLLEIQRAISHHAPLPEVLDTITTGASALLDGVPVTLLRAHPEQPDDTAVLSTSGSAPAAEAVLRTAAAAAVTSDGMVTSGAGAQTLLAAPVHVGGERIGGIVAELPATGAPVEEHRALLAAYAEQVSLALTNAHMVSALHEAFHDALTGLPARGLFLQRLELAMSTAAAAGHQVTVLFIDLDGFKAVNDSYGHQAGDELLAAAAGRLRGCLRADHDTAARLGGDEFAVLLIDRDGLARGTGVAARVVDSLQRPIALGAAGRSVCVTASVGIAVAGPDASTAEALLDRADTAMYEAKRGGTGQVAVYGTVAAAVSAERAPPSATSRRPAPSR